MPPLPTPLTAWRTLSRFARPASRFTPLSTRRPLPIQQLPSLRFSHSPYSTTTPPAEDETTNYSPVAPKSSHKPPARARPPQPEYELTFTCTPCSTRSTHRISKQGYHFGSVLITCPECHNRHVIADHLNIFGDRDMTVEDLMREKGMLVKKGTLSGDGDLEFWEDGGVESRRERRAREKGVGKEVEGKGDEKGAE